MRRQSGVTYVIALFLVSAVGTGLALTGVIWSHANQREKEAELIWIGNQFKQAIGMYYQRSPGSIKRYPEKLDDLLEDRRYLSMQRHLRKIYIDPMTMNANWGVVPAPGGGIMGVQSLSNGRPIRTVDKGASYADWQFVYEPPIATQNSSSNTNPTAPNIAPKSSNFR